MLLVENLHKRFGDHVALRSLNIQVAPGEIYALLGPNGAGKTTTINASLGFLKPDGGRVLIAGVDPALDPDRARARLAYIPEQVNLYGQLSGSENLAYFAELAGQRLPRDRLRTLLTDAGLQHEAHERKAAGYSKGMRQKVGIAIALAKDARVLLLDEPTSGLDPSASHEFSTLVRSLSNNGVAVLMATHDLFRARDLADRVGIMKSGVLRRELSADEVETVSLEALYLEEMRAE
ncbi:MAG: ABC transporter ATP-binding protein [Pseudomonadota bacterium]|nr:ABC transporter ATP-binding protein [Pseudomonadota bacterium]